MHLYKLIFSIAFFLSALSAQGVDIKETEAHLQTACRISGNKAELMLRFDKKQPAELREFSGAPILFLQTKKNTHLIEDLTAPHPGDFSFVPITEKSGCDGTQAFSLSKNTLAILYSQDNRPFQAIYKVVFWDAKKDKILFRQSLGPVSQYMKVKNGFAFSTIVERSDADSIEMTTSAGLKMNASDKDLEALQVLKFDGKDVKIEFDPDLSFEKSPWKKFFKSKDDYLLTIGWSEAEKKIKNQVVYYASNFNRSKSNIEEMCAAFTDKRGGVIAANSWRCLKEKR